LRVFKAQKKAMSL